MCPGAAGRAARKERGAVTAELAVVLPVVVLLIALLGAGARAGITGLQTQSAARAAARCLARGEAEPAARAIVDAQLGHDAEVSLSRSAGLVRVVVRQRIAVAGDVVLPLTVTGEASASVELSAAASARGTDDVADPTEGRRDRPENSGW